MAELSNCIMTLNIYIYFYMKNKQNKDSQDSLKGEQNNTAQRPYRKHLKKYTEDNKAHRKHKHSEGNSYSLKVGK